MTDLTREVLDFRDATVALSMAPDPEPRPPRRPRAPRYSAGMNLAAYAAGFQAANDQAAKTPDALEGDALAAWRHGREAGKP